MMRRIRSQLMWQRWLRRRSARRQYYTMSQTRSGDHGRPTANLANGSKAEHHDGGPRQLLGPGSHRQAAL